MGEQRAVRRRLAAFGLPIAVVHDGGPFIFAFGDGVAAECVDEVVVAFADGGGPGTGLADCEAVSGAEGNGGDAVKGVGREVAGLRVVDGHFVEPGGCSSLVLLPLGTAFPLFRR